MNITLSRLCINYHEHEIISGLNHTFAASCFHIILGKSGAGKSSLLRAMAGLLPYRGKIYDDNGHDLTGKISLMAQDDDLLPWLNSIENTILGARLRGEPPDIERAKRLLEATGLGQYSQQFPKMLSGGQRQRIALARTLYENRPVILMDEPFSAVDAVTRYQLQNLTAKLLKHKTVIMITHDPAEALRLADYLYILEGRPAVLSQQPLPEGKPPRNTCNPQPLLQALGV